MKISNADAKELACSLGRLVVNLRVSLKPTHAVLGCADEGAGESNIFSFATDPLLMAGDWTVVVEYAEQRPELSKALTKREAALRSTAATFQARSCCIGFAISTPHNASTLIQPCMLATLNKSVISEKRSICLMNEPKRK